MFKKKYFYYTENHQIEFHSSKKAHFYLDQLITLVNSYTNRRAKLSDLLVQIQKPLREDKEFKKVIQAWDVNFKRCVFTDPIKI